MSAMSAMRAMSAMSACHWLERELHKGQRFRVFAGCTYGTISQAGVAVQDAADDADAPFFELPAHALRNVER